MKKIKFTYLSKYAYSVCEKPKPSKEFLPDWFTKMTPYIESKRPLVRNRITNATAKKCVPMFDSIISGYTVPLWSDVEVSQTSEFPMINWKVSKPVFELHGESSREISPPPGFDQVVFKYIPYFTISTPPGYSVLVKPVSGHDDAIFRPISAIIDSDKSLIDINFPVWIKTGFEGIIKKGTPMVQLLPFKRDNWQSEFDYIEENTFIEQIDKGFLSTIVNHYAKNIWSKKNFI